MVGDTMLEVIELNDGVFQVTVTYMQRDCINRMSQTADICCEAVLAMWIGSGMTELSAFAQDEPESQEPPPKSIDENPPAYE